MIRVRRQKSLALLVKLMVMVILLLILGPATIINGAGTNILDKTGILNSYGRGDNQWFIDNIPFLDCPDANIKDIYYYRWWNYKYNIAWNSTLSGWVINEGGGYGVTPCPLGHHFYEGRWLKDRAYLNDYMRFWFSGIDNPRRYSNWLADSFYAKYLVDYDQSRVTSFLTNLTGNYSGWESERFDSVKGLFKWIPDRDGMEASLAGFEEGESNNYDWNTVIFGGEGYRPSLNSYMYADAMAIKKIAELAGDNTTANTYNTKATNLRAKIISDLWDSGKNFFVQRKSSNYAFLSGREEIGFFPWYFNIPDNSSAYSQAWSQLMDSQGFYATYGPTTLERRNTHFMQSFSHSCLWNGPSWPYSTSVTLTAMANLLNNYTQSYVTKDNYFTILRNYAITQHDPNGTAMVREDHHPDENRWLAQGANYNHSSYCDQVITGLIGLRPRADGVLEVNPLAPSSWSNFCLEDVMYHGRLVTILYDNNGSHYGKGSGLKIFIDGSEVASSASITRLTVNFSSYTPPPPTPTPTATPGPTGNLALNTSGSGYPAPSASYTFSMDNVWQAIDGIISYTDSNPRNRWTCYSSGNSTDWLAVDFGTNKSINQVRLYIYDDGGGVKAPAGYNVQYWTGSAWADTAAQSKAPSTPAGSTVNTDTFTLVSTQKVRVVFTHQSGSYSGVTEMEVYGSGATPTPTPTSAPTPTPAATSTPTPTPTPAATATPTPVNIALNTSGSGYPSPSASYTYYQDNVWQAIDGVISYTDHSPRNRWTCYSSGQTSDWLAVDFGSNKTVSKIKLYIYDDGGGVKAPASYNIQYWSGSAWVNVASQVKSPSTPAGNTVNTVTFTQVNTARIRVVFTHKSGSYSGVTELEAFSN